MKTTLFALLIAVGSLLSGCSTIQSAGDWVNENPMFADIATRQAITRIIDAGETQEDKMERAVEVKTVIERTMVYLEGNPQTTASGIVQAIETNIAWEKLNVADQMLVRDVMLVVQLELADRMTEQQLSRDTLLAVDSLLKTAASAAAYFLR